MNPPGEFVNADLIAKRLDPLMPGKMALSAGRETLNRLSALIGTGANLTYETTLSSQQSLSLMARCRAAEYQISLIFVALENSDLHVRRVAERVRLGGHHIDTDVIRRRYRSSFEHLPQAIVLSDEVLLVDNTGTEPALVFTASQGSVAEDALSAANSLHRRFAEAVARASQLRA